MTPAQLAARRGNRVLRLRRQLRTLDDIALLKRIAKYRGLTPSEARREYRNLYAWSARAIDRIDRDRIIAAIVQVEEPS